MTPTYRKQTQISCPLVQPWSNLLGNPSGSLCWVTPGNSSDFPLLATNSLPYFESQIRENGLPNWIFQVKRHSGSLQWFTVGAWTVRQAGTKQQMNADKLCPPPPPSPLLSSDSCNMIHTGWGVTSHITPLDGRGHQLDFLWVVWMFEHCKEIYNAPSPSSPSGSTTLLRKLQYDPYPPRLLWDRSIQLTQSFLSRYK